MAKNKGKVIQMLSPENYIRKKARLLPVYDCLLSSNWKESGMATIVIARRHTNGNITFCLYLVDLYCLGVKDTFYQFNVTETEFRRFLEKLDQQMEMTITDYVFVHNVILAGIEYAEDFGFKPHKDYTSVTQYMLEEDTDDIELIEIECGKDGKPFYVQGPNDSEATINKIIKQLEHSAGKGNFNFMREYNPDPEDDWGLDDEYAHNEMDLEEKGTEFIQYYNRLAKLNDDEFEDFLVLLQSIADDMMDVDEYNQFYDVLMEELTELEIDLENIPNELLGIKSENLNVSDEAKQAFVSIIYEGSLKQKKRQFKAFRKNKEIEAAIDYLDILIAGLEGSGKYKSKLKEAVAKHPKYAILQLKWTKNKIKLDETPELLPHYPCKMENYFQGRDSIHPWEYFCYLDTYTHVVLAEKNFAKTEALKAVLTELDLNDEEATSLFILINMFQTEIVAGYLKNEYNME